MNDILILVLGFVVLPILFIGGPWLIVRIPSAGFGRWW